MTILGCFNSGVWKITLHVSRTNEIVAKCAGQLLARLGA
jgi:hypothetical protein